MKLNKFLFVSLLLTHSLANAQSYVYITDTVDIPMRSANKIQNNPSNLLKMLPSGTKLKILSTESGWTKVKYEKTTGWMISRYLTSKAPAKAQLEKLRQTYNANKLLIAKQSKRNAELEAQALLLKDKNTLLSVQTGKTQAEKEHIEQVYKDALKLEYNNEKLKTEILQLKTEIQLLQNNDIAGQESSSRNWFIVGALVLFFGFIMGFVFPKRTNQRRF